ncbi:MAG: hypothetical protein ISS26_00170 [Candidatus Omnitrophica bacterium]|nr:hypothetical protein [Candidatus Omnitrophota bacterium]
MIRSITSEDFKPFGCVIEYPDKDKEDKDKNLFCVTLKETEKVGWRIAYLVLRDKAIDSLEQHPRSFESFEPVSGKALLYVAAEKNVKDIRCYYLDKPVILNKGVWHGVVTVGGESEVKITENADVECVFWQLESGLDSRGFR